MTSIAIGEKIAEPVLADKTTMAKVVLSSFIGNTIEFYDFLVYGLAAALVFGRVFFPNTTPLAAILASFATFGVGFVARPLGGIFFGHLGDTVGRKKTLVITLVGMGTATSLIGLLPTYDQIGVVAPVLLVVLRFLQGFAVGGEWGGAMLIVVENAPANRRGFFSAWPQTGGFSGQLLATGAFTLVGFLPDDQLMSWGWRLPFLASAILVAFGLYLRSKLDETAVFKATQAQAKPREHQRAPFIEVFSGSWRSLLLIMLLRFAESVPFFLVTVFAVSYATGQLGVQKQTLLNVIMVTCLIAFPAHGVFGALSDKVGRRPIYIFGALFAALSAFPFFYLLQTGNMLLIGLGYVLLINVAHNSINAVQPSFFTELFGARIRYSGASIGHQFGAIVAGGATPFVAKSLSAADGNGWTYVAAYVVVGALVSAVAAYLGPETSKRILTETR